jgi:hypothetical protein
MLAVAVILLFVGDTGAMTSGCQYVSRGSPPRFLAPQYISFVRAGEGAPARTFETTRSRVWLSIHNNTTCEIVLDGPGVQVIYIDPRTHAQLPWQLHGGAEVRLGSGQSLEFSVAANMLRKYAVAVPFWFSWEFYDTANPAAAVVHQVEFGSDLLPSDVQVWLRKAP